MSSQDLVNSEDIDYQDEMPAFLTMAKAVGSLCNLDCSYCYYLEKASLFQDSHSYRMKDDVLTAYIKNAVNSTNSKTIQFVWHGGEPTLLGIEYYEKVVQIQKQFAGESRRCINIIQTNGMLLNKDWCDLFKRENFWVGLSMDGPTKLHNANRVTKAKSPTHKQVEDAYRLLVGEGIDPDVLCTLNSVNVKHPREVYGYFRDLKVRWLQFLPIVRRDEDGTLSKESVTAADLGYFLTKVFDQWVRNDVGKIDVQTFVETLMSYTNGYSVLCINAKQCGNVLVVERDGGIYSCDHFVYPSHYLGNVVDTELSDALNSPFQAEFSENKSKTLAQKCIGCKYLFACNGGCPKDRIGPEDQNGNRENILCSGYLEYYDYVDRYMKIMSRFAKSDKPIGTIMTQLKYEEKLAKESKKATKNKRGSFKYENKTR